MTIAKVLEDLATLRQHTDDNDRIRAHLVRLEDMVRREIYDMPICTGGISDEQTLVVTSPYDSIYLQYALAMQDLEDKEYGTYNNDMAVFAQSYDELQKRRRWDATPRQRCKVTL